MCIAFVVGAIFSFFRFVVDVQCEDDVVRAAAARADSAVGVGHSACAFYCFYCP